jgi:hypothetical protein
VGGRNQAAGDQEDYYESDAAINQPFLSLLAATVPVHICLLSE